MSGEVKQLIVKIATKLFNYMRENKVSFVGGKVIKGGNKGAKVESLLKTLLDVVLLVLTIIMIATDAVSKDEVIAALKHYADADPAEVVEEVVVHPHMNDAKKAVHQGQIEDAPRHLAIEDASKLDLDTEVDKAMEEIFGDFGVDRVADEGENIDVQEALKEFEEELANIGKSIVIKLRRSKTGYRGVQYYDEDFEPRRGLGDVNIVDKTKEHKGQIAPVTVFRPKKVTYKHKGDKSWIKKEGGSSKRNKRTQKRRNSRRSKK